MSCCGQSPDASCLETRNAAALASSVLALRSEVASPSVPASKASIAHAVLTTWKRSPPVLVQGSPPILV